MPRDGVGLRVIIIVQCKALHGNAVARYSQHPAEIAKAARLRVGDTVEAHVPGYVAEALRWIEAARQVQSRQHRQINFSRPRPEAAGHVMNKVKAAAFLSSLPHQSQNRFLVLAIAAFVIVRLRAGVSRRQKFAADPRSRRRSHRGVCAALCHLAFQRPQHLLGAAGRFIADGEQGIRDIEDTKSRHVP